MPQTKVRKSGKSSFVVTIPTEFAEQFNIREGDEIEWDIEANLGRKNTFSINLKKRGRKND